MEKTEWFLEGTEVSTDEIILSQHNPKREIGHHNQGTPSRIESFHTSLSYPSPDTCSVSSSSSPDQWQEGLERLQGLPIGSIISLPGFLTTTDPPPWQIAGHILLGQLPSAGHQGHSKWTSLHLPGSAHLLCCCPHSSWGQTPLLAQSTGLEL
jgi:hypothetical protein